MSQKDEHSWGRWIVSLVICSVPLGIGGLISYNNPLTVVRMERTLAQVGDRQSTVERVDAVLELKLLFFIPRGSAVINDVTKIEYAELSRYKGEITFHGTDGPANVLSSSRGRNKADELNVFLSDSSQESQTVRLAPATVPVIFLGGIGVLFVGAILLGSLGRVLWFANLFPHDTDSEGEVPPEIAKSLKRGLALTTVVAWQPGQRILLRRRISASAYLFTFAFAAVLGGVFGAWLFDLKGAMIIGAAAGCVLCCYLAAKSPSRSMLIDWQDGSIVIREGWSRFRKSLAEIDRLKVNLLFTRRSQSGESREKVLEYRSQLNICFDKKESMLVDTDDWRKDKKLARQDLASLAETMAGHLNVSVSNGGESREPSFVSELFRRPFSLPSLVMAVAVAGVLWFAGTAGWGFYQQTAAKSSVRKAGGKITNLSSKSIGKWNVLTKGKGVSFESPIDNEKLAGISGDLRRIPRLDLDLSNSSINDEGLRHLMNASNILSLDLSNSAISDAGLETIASFRNLVELKLSGCSITDEGLERLQSLRRLRFLGLTKTRITDIGLSHLYSLRGLNQLTIGWGSVTPQGARELQDVLSRTEVRRLGPPNESEKKGDEVTARNGTPLAADGGPQLVVIRDYLKAVAQNDKDAMRAAFSSQVNLTFAYQIHGKIREPRSGGESGWRSLLPVTVGYFKGFVRGNHATVVVNGLTSKGSGATFQYQLIREGADWKIVRGRLK